MEVSDEKIMHGANSCKNLLETWKILTTLSSKYLTEQDVDIAWKLFHYFISAKKQKLLVRQTKEQNFNPQLRGVYLQKIFMVSIGVLKFSLQFLLRLLFFSKQRVAKD